MSKVDARDISRRRIEVSEYGISIEWLQAGAILRIADAVEVMCKNTRNLELERDQLRANWKGACGRIAERDRTISALKGHITKLKKQIAALKGES